MTDLEAKASPLHPPDSDRPTIGLECPHKAEALPNLPIDAVYTWVDGADPNHQQSLARHKRFSLWPWSPGDNREARFRQNEELRFSLRSLERFAPWIRHVYLVTNGQVPKWLNTANKRLRLVRHEEIFPNAEDLPTFNSLAIEVNLHRIKGLAENFLYFNDDVFLGRSITLADFFTSTGEQLITFDDWNIPKSRRNGTLNDRALFHTAQLLDAHFGKLSARPAIAHVPHMCSTTYMAELEAIWPEQFKRTSASRFRKSDNIVLWPLYFHSMLENKKPTGIAQLCGEGNWQSTYRFTRTTSNFAKNAIALANIVVHRPKFFCLNDDFVETKSPAAVKALAAIRSFLESYFPEKSSFETD